MFYSLLKVVTIERLLKKLFTLNYMDIVQESEETDEFLDFYLDHLVEKARARKSRKTEFNSKGYNGKRTHWANHAGTFKDKELRKGPNYWHGQKPVRVYNPIKSYKDLATAIGLIASGDKGYSDYPGVSGTIRERLRIAQSWRDKRRAYYVSDIVCLTMSEIKKELGFGKSGFGIVYHH